MKKKKMVIGFALLLIMAFLMQACDKAKTENVDSNKKASDTIDNQADNKTKADQEGQEERETPAETEVPTASKEAEISDTPTDQTESETGFDDTKTLSQNIQRLNNILETTYGQTFNILTRADYETREESDWTLILDEDKVGIDTSTWRFDYEPGTEEGKYMEAIMTTCKFFYGEDMGNALWLLTDDLIDQGADESLYGFTHEGGKAIYKNGATAAFEINEKGNFYLWFTPTD